MIDISRYSSTIDMGQQARVESQVKTSDGKSESKSTTPVNSAERFGYPKVFKTTDDLIREK